MVSSKPTTTNPGDAALFVPPERERDSARVSKPPSGGSVSWRQDSPEAYVVVLVVRVVVVAIGNPAVVGVVVPTAAAFHGMVYGMSTKSYWSGGNSLLLRVTSLN